MVTLTLPRLVGGRHAADDLVDTLGDAVRDEEVALLCRELVSGSPSFADQVVARLLVTGGAQRLVVVGAGSEFAGYVQAAAGAHGVAGRVALAEAGSLAG